MLKGRIAVVTGGASGLGAAAVRRFHAEGARVGIADIDEAGAIALAAELDASGRSTFGLRCDVTDPTDCAALVAHAERTFAAPIDIFLANAGLGFAGDLIEADADRIRRVVEVNVTGSIFSAQAALVSLVRSPNASLLFTASLQSFVGRPQRSVYTATKHAISGLVKALAVEYGPRAVRVNAIAPAATDTPFLRAQLANVTDDVDGAVAQLHRGLPLQHLPSVEDFADAAVFLSSQMARSITGVTLLVDCGAAAGAPSPGKPG
jgi:NAD(P)-dependent dehydrogenase (short-subunit alcohol dehydrogenase family)